MKLVSKDFNFRYIYFDASYSNLLDTLPAFNIEKLYVYDIAVRIGEK